MELPTTATALARGFIRAGLVRANQLIASDVSETARKAFEEETGAKSTGSNSEVAEFAKVLMLAVKPDQVVPVLSGIRNDFSKEHLLISIAAGVPLAKLE